VGGGGEVNAVAAACRGEAGVRSVCELVQRNLAAWARDLGRVWVRRERVGGFIGGVAWARG
jgi:hypothetical protein